MPGLFHYTAAFAFVAVMFNQSSSSSCFGDGCEAFQMTTSAFSRFVCAFPSARGYLSDLNLISDAIDEHRILSDNINEALHSMGFVCNMAEEGF
ncbi:hypothetical protein MASR2M78_34770 [Treponema sp.]